MQLNRREAIRNLGYTAALFGLPAAAAQGAPTSLPADTLYGSDPERYWNTLRDEQFVLPGKRVFLNTGSLGVAPKPVLKAVNDYLESSAALTTEERYPRWGYETLDEYRETMSQFVGCKKDELAFVHNATEALAVIAGGMPLERGSEVLITDQEHPSGRCPWQVREARGDITVREVTLPIPPENSQQLVDVIISAIGPKTRVLSFSGIMTPTGLLMPVQEICDAAREKGVITVVDGAHMSGQVDYRIDDMHCDYYAGSPHKWLFAPAGSGLLYINENRLDEHFPIVATVGWDNKELKAGRFMRFGTNNRAIFVGMMAGLEFAEAIGHERIYGRIHDLSKQVYARASELDYVDMRTPADDSMYGSLVTFQIELPDARLQKLWTLCDERMIFTTKNPHLRVSTHVHTRQSDLDLFFDTLAEAAA